jgi:hypothetical protein
MSIRSQIELGKELPKHAEYERLARLWKFLDLSYTGGSKYKNGSDADGAEIFIPHELESADGIKRRKRLATYRNYCRPIAQKYNAFIFGYPVVRDQQNATLTEWAKDVDALGTPLDGFMASAALRAEVLGRWFLLLDTTKGVETQTQAQARAAGNRVFVTGIHPTRVLAWSHAREIDQLTEVLIHSPADNLARLYTASDVTLIQLKTDTMTVAFIDEPQPHEYKRPPVVMVTALLDGASLIGDIAELNKSLFNLDALMREELFKQTFTQFFASGMNAQGIKSASFGGRKLLCHKNKDVKIDRLTGDVSQAESIRASIREDVGEIYRLAGLSNPDVVQNTESGRALKIRWNEIALIAAQIADRTERAENQVLTLWARALGTAEPTASDYPEEFDAEDLAVELQATLDVMDSDLPWVLKEQHIQGYAQRKFPKMSDQQKRDLQAQLDELKAGEAERRTIAKQLTERLPDPNLEADPNKDPTKDLNNDPSKRPPE